MGNVIQKLCKYYLREKRRCWPQYISWCPAHLHRVLLLNCILPHLFETSASMVCLLTVAKTYCFQNTSHISFLNIPPIIIIGCHPRTTLSEQAEWRPAVCRIPFYLADYLKAGRPFVSFLCIIFGFSASNLAAHPKTLETIESFQRLL